MARGHNVYVVCDDEGGLVAAFTVRYEAEDWIARMQKEGWSFPNGCQLRRYPDGPYKEPYKFTHLYT